MNTPQNELPYATQLTTATREVNRANTSRGRETSQIKFADIVCLPEMNIRLRENYGEIKELAYSIRNHGLEMPLIVDAYTDSKGKYVVYLNDGFRRYSAIKWIRDNYGKDEFNVVECFINPKQTSQEERITKMFVTQNNKQLEPIEQAECFRRLRDDYGHSSSVIAAIVGKGRMYVDEYLKLADESDAIKNVILNGTVKPTALIELQKTVKSAERRQEITSDLISKGTVKVADFKNAAKNETSFKARIASSSVVVTNEQSPVVEPLQMEIPTPTKITMLTIGVTSDGEVKYFSTAKSIKESYDNERQLEADANVTVHTLSLNIMKLLFLQAINNN